MVFGRVSCLHGYNELVSVPSALRYRHQIVVRETENRQLLYFFISTGESAPAGIAALVPVGSAPELSHKRTEPQLSCRACGTYLHGLNAPGSNLPIRHVPTPRRYASDRPLDHRAWQLPRHDLDVQLAKAEFVPIGGVPTKVRKSPRDLA